MARTHGQRGRLYAGITSAGTAEPISFLSGWTISGTFDKVDVTAFEDTTKTYVTGKPDGSGTFKGFMDLATQQLWTATTDGIARKFYLYPDINTNTTYFWGTAFFDTSFAGGVTQAVEISGNFAAATPFARVG